MGRYIKNTGTAEEELVLELRLLLVIQTTSLYHTFEKFQTSRYLLSEIISLQYLIFYESSSNIFESFCSLQF